ncbi:MAG: hypothetical protein LBG80_02390 [Bacteroidales bacterium]|jgi:hypothetical protein|nr:hypothetical protein [Bacteroidales bacterium]
MKYNVKSIGVASCILLFILWPYLLFSGNSILRTLSVYVILLIGIIFSLSIIRDTKGNNQPESEDVRLNSNAAKPAKKKPIRKNMDVNMSVIMSVIATFIISAGNLTYNIMLSEREETRKKERFEWEIEDHQFKKYRFKIDSIKFERETQINTVAKEK